MNKRQIDLVHYLINADNWVKGDQLATYLNVSSRTVRNDIQSLQLIDIVINSSKKRGYIIENASKVMQRLEKHNEFPENSHERMMFILKKLLHYSEPQNLYDLADDLFVSESTIEKDIYRLRTYISNTDAKVRLVRSENNFLLEGNMRARRTLYSKLLLKEINENIFDINILENAFNEVKLKDINNLLDKVLTEHGIYLNDLSMISMIIHIAIGVDRILCNKETISPVEINFKSSKDELSAAQNICEEIEKIYDITIPLPELEYIAILLGGKKCFQAGDKNKRKAKMKTDNRYSMLARDLITSICDKFSVDLMGDSNLLFGLSMHLKSLDNRNKRGVEIHNPILTDIQKNFPLIYDMGIFMGLEYQRKMGQKLNEDEIGLLTLHLCVAFERLTEKKNTMKFAILCPTGFTTSRLLKVKLKKIYGEQLSSLRIFSMSNRETIINYEPDLILTTTKLPEVFPFKTLKVSPFLSEQDIEEINNHFQTPINSNEQEDITGYFSESLFFQNLKLDSPKEIITFLSDKLEKENIVPPKYSEYILAREEISSTAFGDLIALPHPIEKIASQTMISVCILNNPIEWGNKKVQLVLLFALANDQRELTESLFRVLIDMLDNPKKVKDIIQVKKYEDFVNLIN